MNIRPTTSADVAVVRTLWEEFARELPPSPAEMETWEQEGTEERVLAGDVILAEDGDEQIGFAEIKLLGPTMLWIESLYVREHARRRGVAKALLSAVSAEARRRGVRDVGLEVDTENATARAVYDRLGLKEYSRNLSIGLEALHERLEQAPGSSRGAVYVQTDDRASVERAVAQYVPRLGPSQWARVSEPFNGWVEVHEELSDREPALLRRLARELSDRTGAIVLSLGVEEGAVVRYVLLERGRVADEYASVPEYHRPLPPGDVVALSANPTVLARLTGADPADVRAIARSAPSPGELPPPDELEAQIARLLGIRGG